MCSISRDPAEAVNSAGDEMEASREAEPPGRFAMNVQRTIARFARSAAMGGVMAAGLGTLVLAPATASAGIFISVGFAPPVLPVYTQPLCPGDGYIWTPGYWGYGDEGYYWVPGVWVSPPQPGLLWTPGYWGWGGNAYLFHAGYWGPHVGFFGGVNYGFGYGGSGYQGGYWRGNQFNYNRTVNNINVTNIHNTYNTTIVNNNVTNNRVSYNGGQGGLQARSTPQEMAASREQHVQPTQNQMMHQQNAGQNRAQYASVNHGVPPMAAQARVGDRANFTPARGVANERWANQQQRIANGTRDGQMTTGEAARADQRQASIDRQTQADRQANNGRLNGQERQQINREQNGASRQIQRENHNGNEQHGGGEHR